MNVRDVMSKDLVTVDKDRSLKDVLALMAQHRITKIPVTEDGNLVGIITDGKIADKLGREHNRGLQTSRLHASGVMEKDFIVAHPDEALEVLLADVGKPGLTMIPVVQGKKLVGVVTKANLLALVKSNAALSTLMKTELHSVSPGERLVHARRLLLDNDIARLPVLEGGRISGIIAEHEIAIAFADFKGADAHVQKANIRDLEVGPYMRRQVVTGNPEMTAKQAAKHMLDNHVGALPVVDKSGVVQGIVTRTDLIRTFSQEPIAAKPPKGAANGALKAAPKPAAALTAAKKAVRSANAARADQRLGKNS
ncbi:MAG: CBS domain-containing protein [Candidatus Thermoplasmatota archaeon]|jgi:CBS domain-containing protein